MALDWSQPVFSSNVAEIAYDAEGSEMYVTWLKGKRSIYSGVPEELARQVANAPSVGSIIRTEIIPYFAHRYG